MPLDSHTLEVPIGFDPDKADKLETSKRKRGQKVSIDEGLVSEQYKDFFRIANDMREPRRLVWNTCWDLYNGKYDWVEKENWQAKINIPKVRGVVDKACANFRRALIRMRRFYHIESETRLGVEKGFYTMSLIDYWLDQINFIEEFSTGLKAGLITSTIVFKTFPRYVTESFPRFEDKFIKEPIMELGIRVGEQLIPTQVLVDTPRTKWQLGFQAVDPFNMWVGPLNRYRIEKATVDFSEIEQLAKRGVYDKEAVEQLRGRTGEGVEGYLEAQRKGEHPDSYLSKFSRKVDLYHYWGDLYDEDGSIKEPNVTYTMAGATASTGGVGGATADILLRAPITNPLFHGRDPYVIGTPYIVPFSTYNRGIVEDIIGITKMMTGLANLIIDGAQFDAMQAYEMDSDLLTDPRQAKRGLYPGVTFQTKSYENTGNKNVVRPISTGKVPQLALQILNYLDREQQLATSVTNSLKGAGGGSDTLGEFQSLTAQATDSLDDAARTVEETVLDELLDRIAGTIYQYHEDYTLPRLVENFPQTTNILSGLSNEERYATMIGGFAFKARGVSVFMDKAQDLQKINSFLQLIANIPGVMQAINIPELLENIIIGIGWNPSKILLQQGSPSVYPAAVQGGVPQSGGAPGEQASLTPQQQMNAQQGAQMGGAMNNPGANAGQPLGSSIK